MFLLGATLLLAPIARIVLRKAILAILNFGFLAWILGLRGALAVVFFCIFIFKVAQAVSLYRTSRNQPSYSRVIPTLLLGFSGGLLVFLFYLHKGAGATIRDLFQTALNAARGILVAIGFSYLAMRCVELLRAGVDGLVGGKDVLDAINYQIPFHMLAAGPIQSWAAFRNQPLLPTTLDEESTLQGFERIAGGLLKKFVLANFLETTLLTGFRAPWPYTLLEAQVYCIWVYLDFSAYCDIAVGAGILLGIPTPENFMNPLLARNIIQFWERWHITLSQFLRRNLFIPIQLNLMRRFEGRRPLLIASLAFAVTFLLCGLWHGLSLRFLLWGALHASALITCNLYRKWLNKTIERKALARYFESPLIRGVSIILTFEFVSFSLVFITHPAFAFLGGQ